jgi:hypothetical protein
LQLFFFSSLVRGHMAFSPKSVKHQKQLQKQSGGKDEGGLITE